MLTTLLAKYYHWFDLLLVFVFKQRFIMALTHPTSVHGDIIVDIRPYARTFGIHCKFAWLDKIDFIALMQPAKELGQLFTFVLVNSFSVDHYKRPSLDWGRLYVLCYTAWITYHHTVMYNNQINNAIGWIFFNLIAVNWSEMSLPTFAWTSAWTDCTTMDDVWKWVWLKQSFKSCTISGHWPWSDVGR